MKKIYIHCGLHKTGTTSLQKTLSQHASILSNHNVLYPNIAMPFKNPGHHNLAWQLSRDRRFNPALGTWSNLFSSLKRHKGDVVISSEDFESSLLKPKRWIEIVKSLKEIGFELVFLVYLREPISYLESLYMENLKSGCGEEFHSVFSSICEYGKFTYKEYEFCFDYPLIKSAISSINGVELIFRNYDDLVEQSISYDFMSLMRLDNIFSRNSASELVLNKRNSLQESLKLFVRNRNWSWSRRNNPEKIYLAIDFLCVGKSVRLITPPDLKKVFNRRFNKSIEFVANINNSSVSNLKTRDLTAPSSTERSLICVNIQRVFSFETYLFLINLAEELDSQNNHSDPKRLQKRVSDWWDWVLLKAESST